MWSVGPGEKLSPCIEPPRDSRDSKPQDEWSPVSPTFAPGALRSLSSPSLVIQASLASHRRYADGPS